MLKSRMKRCYPESNSIPARRFIPSPESLSRIGSMRPAGSIRPVVQSMCWREQPERGPCADAGGQISDFYGVGLPNFRR